MQLHGNTSEICFSQATMYMGFFKRTVDHKELDFVCTHQELLFHPVSLSTKQTRRDRISYRELLYAISTLR